uniref:Armadillo repeat-containing protein 6 n=1 Tax=Schistosoma japonicum TaxID=6182 RepID=C1LE28_SCHJA|nr:Armadillo repeat-containing protein 6 [Schistosoma japonicum]
MRKVSQSYFDETVKSNMELCDLPVDDAIAESIQSFNLEGVDLSDIVKDMVKYEKGHPSVLAIKKLEECLENSHDKHLVLETLQSLQLQCNTDPAVRKLLIDMNAVNILISLCDSHVAVDDYDLCASLLNVLSKIIKDHSDSVNEDHIRKVINLLLKQVDELDKNSFTDSKSNLIAGVYSVLHFSCTRNEKNRTFISETQAVNKTITFLAKMADLFENLPFNTFYPALKHGCAFLRSLTHDDDFDVEFGFGSENARTIAKRGSCLEVFVILVSKILNSSNVIGISDLFQTLSTIITREELCTKFASLNGIDILMQSIYFNMKSIVIVSSGLMLLQAVCGSDACKLSVGNWSMHNISGPQLIVDIFEEYINSPIVTKHLSRVIAILTLRLPDLAKSLITSGASMYLIKTLELHLSNPPTVRAACRAIRNCVSRSPELRSSFLTSDSGTDTGLEKLLNCVLKIPSCCDEAKAALRDLNCKVELQELWKGHP